jgi:hypothetical protein
MTMGFYANSFGLSEDPEHILALHIPDRISHAVLAATDVERCLCFPEDLNIFLGRSRLKLLRSRLFSSYVAEAVSEKLDFTY